MKDDDSDRIARVRALEKELNDVLDENNVCPIEIIFINKENYFSQENIDKYQKLEVQTKILERQVNEATHHINSVSSEANKLKVCRNNEDFYLIKSRFLGTSQ